LFETNIEQEVGIFLRARITNSSEYHRFNSQSKIAPVNVSWTRLLRARLNLSLHRIDCCKNAVQSLRYSAS